MTLDEKRQALLDELSPFDDPRDRFQYIIDRAQATEGLDEEFKISSLLIEGCTSHLWMYPRHENGCCHFRADADAIITKGIATLVCDFYTGATPDEVIETDTNFLTQVGITQHLSPNRRNGLSNLVAKIRAFAEFIKNPPPPPETTEESPPLPSPDP
ncbi:MAG: SufE family protein [Puniceicoccales bacterium]|jgi:cysteine desulfuration protein SufE|nr:SufE family protein [Puniceicoccales bacterium]